MFLDINVTHSFTDKDDTNYWDTYSNGHSDTDPDIHSQTLRTYQQKLYSNRKCNGKQLLKHLVEGKNKHYDYLICTDTGTRFGSDSIINMYAYQLPEVEKEIYEYKTKIRDYIEKGYTIGGEIIFPKHRMSMNQCRGINHKIRDRFDLTLECIRLFYEGKDNPLSKVLNTDKAFFNLFVDENGENGFKNYVDFFFLNDLILPNGKINFFLDTKTDIFSCNDPRPQNKQEWQQLYDNQMIFLENRNKKINDFALKG